MNIALVIPEFNTERGPYKSLSVYTYRAAAALKQLGHRPIIFAGSNSSSESEYLGIEIHFVKIHKRDEKWYSNKFLHKPYSALRKALYEKTSWHKWNDHLERKYYCKTLSEQLNKALLQVHHTIPFDVIHYAQECAVGYHRPSFIPVVVRASIPHITNMALEGFIADKYIRSRARFEKAALEKADALFGSGQEILAAIEKETGRKSSPVETPFTAIHSEDTSVYEKNLAGKKYILFYGSLNLVNGADTVADTLPDFLRKHRDYYFVFAGSSSVSPYPKMNMLEYIQKKGMENKDRVVCLGHLPQSQLFPIVRNSAAVVLPSRYDSFSNSKTEALAHKRILVCTKTSGPQDLVEDEKNGFVINKEGHKELFHALTRIIELSPARKQQMEEESGRRALRASAEVAGKQLVDFYLKVIKERKG